jgi:hypothetical protein
MSVSQSRIESHRPVPLYFYGERAEIERARQLGEFRLRPNGVEDASSRVLPTNSILPFGARKKVVPGGFLTLSLSSVWHEKISRTLHNETHCLVINDTEKFGEWLHRIVQKALPQWAGIDAAVTYGKPSPLGAAFTKSVHLASQKEWLFAWRPIRLVLPLQPIVVQMGCIDGLTEVRALA